MGRTKQTSKFGPGDQAWYWTQRMGNYELFCGTIMRRAKASLDEEAYDIQWYDDQIMLRSARFLFKSRDEAKEALCEHLKTLVQLQKGSILANAERTMKYAEDLGYYKKQLKMWQADCAAIPVKFERTAQDKLDQITGALDLALLDCNGCKGDRCTCKLRDQVVVALEEVRGER